MKKIISLLMVCALAFLLLTGCGNKENAQKNLNENSQNVVMSEEEVSKTKSEILNFAKHINEAREFQKDFLSLKCDTDKRLSDEKNPYPKVENYYESQKYHSIEEFKAEALKYYSENAAYENYFKYSESADDYRLNGGPYMIESDSKLYADTGRFGGGSFNVYDPNGIDVIYICGDNAIIKVHCYNIEDPSTDIEKIYNMVKENGRWVFDEYVL